MTRCVILPFSGEVRKPSAQRRKALEDNSEMFASNLPKLLQLNDTQMTAISGLCEGIYPTLFGLLEGKVPESPDRISFNIAMLYAFGVAVGVGQNRICLLRLCI